MKRVSPSPAFDSTHCFRCIFRYVFLFYLGSVHAAVAIRCNAFSPARASHLICGPNDVVHQPRLGPSDSNSTFPAGIVAISLCIGRFGVRYVLQGVVLVDKEAPRPAELLPTRQRVAVLIENLNPVVPPGRRQTAGPANRKRQSVWLVQLTLEPSLSFQSL